MVFVVVGGVGWGGGGGGGGLKKEGVGGIRYLAACALLLGFDAPWEVGLAV